MSWPDGETEVGRAGVTDSLWRFHMGYMHPLDFVLSLGLCVVLYIYEALNLYIMSTTLSSEGLEPSRVQPPSK